MAGWKLSGRIGASFAPVLVSALFVIACTAEGTTTIPPGTAEPTLTLVSPQIRVGDGLRAVPDTLVFASRDANGEPRQRDKLYFTGTTGRLRALPASDWGRPDVYETDSLGVFRALWLPSASGVQTLAVTASGPRTVTRTFSLARPGVPFRADSMVTSGSEAICFQRAGRIGCVGTGKCRDCGAGESPRIATDSVHWFRLTAAPRTLTSTLSGACALLIDGSTTCWDGLGPEGIARNDAGHPPFVEFTGSIGRTAAGAVWKGVISGSSGFAQLYQHRTWNLIPSDSVITSLLADFDESFVCGRTASDAVMCSYADRGLLEPSVIMQPFRPLRALPDSSVVRARSGYTAVYYTATSASSAVVARSADGTSLRFLRSGVTPTGWYSSPIRDSTLSGLDVRTRACVAELSPDCDAVRPWQQVSIAGRMTGPDGGAATNGFRRTCGVRDVIVCHLLITRRGGQGSFPYRYEIVDTVRMAP